MKTFTYLFIIIIFSCFQIQCASTLTTTVIPESEWNYVWTSESPDIPVPPTREYINFKEYSHGFSPTNFTIVKEAIMTLLTNYDDEVEAIFKEYDFKKEFGTLSFFRKTTYHVNFKVKNSKTKGVLTISFLPLLLPETEKISSISSTGGTKMYYSFADVCYRIHTVVLKNGKQYPDYAIFTPACGDVSYVRDFLKKGIKENE